MHKNSPQPIISHGHLLFLSKNYVFCWFSSYNTSVHETQVERTCVVCGDLIDCLEQFGDTVCRAT